MDVTGVRHAVSPEVLAALEQASAAEAERAVADSDAGAEADAAADSDHGAATDPGEVLLALSAWRDDTGAKPLPEAIQPPPSGASPEMLAAYVVEPVAAKASGTNG
ncbi:MAG: hypothetical protein ACLFS2_02460 [Halochromatium sp.]|uniref:hypothetical protein n=1 Tax=Halochromatium sp. TaxID=2049430 RepID=UPI00397AA67B